MAVVLDTDIISYLHKQDSRAELYRPHLSNFPYAISFMTITEMRRWMLEHNWGTTKREKLEEYLSSFLIIFADDDLCSVWADVNISAKKNGA